MTKGERCDIITELSERDGFEKANRFEKGSSSSELRKKPRKKLKKLLKNRLTKASECDIISKLTERDRRDQQKRSRKSNESYAKSLKLIEN